jgi:hypothetical protein
MILGGCMRSGIKVVPVPSQDVLTLTPDEVILILQRIGFVNEQIREHGWSVSEGLAKSGAVRIFVDGSVEAGLAIKGDEVFISSRSRGQFIYNINTGWVDAPTGM